MIEIKESIELKCDRRKVDEFIENMETNYLIWSDEHISFKNIKGIPNVKGSVFEQYEYFDGKKIGGKYKVTKVVKNKYYEWSACVPRSIIGGKFIIKVKSVNGFTVIEEVIQIGYRGRFFSKIFDKVIVKVLEINNVWYKLKKHQVDGLKVIKRLIEEV